MKHFEELDQHNRLLRKLCHIPRSIVTLHGNDNVSQFILHELCDANCFNFSRAAYLVDNPDFNCLRGVAGFDKKEICAASDGSCNQFTQFSKHALDSDFNKEVCAVEMCSMYKNACEQKVLDELSKKFCFKNPGYYCWPLKYDNHGILLFEQADCPVPWAREDLENGAHLLGLCSVS